MISCKGNHIEAGVLDGGGYAGITGVFLTNISDPPMREVNLKLAEGYITLADCTGNMLKY